MGELLPDQQGGSDRQFTTDPAIGRSSAKWGAETVGQVKRRNGYGV